MGKTKIVEFNPEKDEFHLEYHLIIGCFFVSFEKKQKDGQVTNDEFPM